MVLAHFSMSIYESFNKDTDKVPEEAFIIILDSKSSVCMYNIIKDTKHIRHTYIIISKFQIWVLS